MKRRFGDHRDFIAACGFLKYRIRNRPPRTAGDGESKLRLAQQSQDFGNRALGELSGRHDVVLVASDHA